MEKLILKNNCRRFNSFNKFLKILLIRIFAKLLEESFKVCVISLHMFYVRALLGMVQISWETGICGDRFSFVSYSVFSLTVKLLAILDSNQFILLFFSVFGGALIVTFNTRVLGGRISFFQSVAILGYCIFPLFIATIVLMLMKFANITSSLAKIIVVVVGCLWCILCIFN